MNKRKFRKLKNKLWINYDKAMKRDEYLLNMYKMYEEGSKLSQSNINITIEDFIKITREIYDVLLLILKEKEIEYSIESYIRLLMNDTIKGYNVDKDWFINHVWYLSFGEESYKYINKYQGSILFIQNELIDEFKIKESIKDRLKRRIYTNFMIKKV